MALFGKSMDKLLVELERTAQNRAGYTPKLEEVQERSNVAGKELVELSERLPPLLALMKNIMTTSIGRVNIGKIQEARREWNGILSLMREIIKREG